MENRESRRRTQEIKVNGFFQAVRDLFCETCECCNHTTYFRDEDGDIDVFVAYASPEHKIYAFLILGDMRYWLKANSIMDHRMPDRSYKAQEKLSRKRNARAIVKVGDVLEVIDPKTWEREEFPTYKVGVDDEDVYDNEPIPSGIESAEFALYLAQRDSPVV